LGKLSVDELSEHELSAGELPLYRLWHSSAHWWINEGYPETCLEEAEYLASLTPVRLGEQCFKAYLQKT
jgi:hypothetical protein